MLRPQAPAEAGAAPRVQGVQSLERALDILEALAEAEGALSLSAVSGRTGLHASTTHRLLAVLVRREYAARGRASGHYALGPRVAALAQHMATVETGDLRTLAAPHLRDLARRSGETTNLVVPVDGSVVYIDQVASRHLMRMFTQIGMRAPAYCTAAGKAMLAHRGAAEVERYLAQTPLQAHTPHTLTTAEALRAQLAQVRTLGYAVDEGEMEVGVRCIAAPIVDAAGVPRGAISVSGPASRFSSAHVAETLPHLLAATAEVSARLGHRPTRSGERGE